MDGMEFLGLGGHLGRLYRNSTHSIYRFVTICRKNHLTNLFKLCRHRALGQLGEATTKGCVYRLMEVFVGREETSEVQPH